MITRNITLERDGAYWLVHIDGTGGLTQARRLSEAETMAREYVSLVEDVAVTDVTIGTVTIEGVTSRLDRAARARAEARTLEAAANQTIRDIAKDLRGQRVSLADIGTILGVSHQRAHQLTVA